MLCLQCSEQDSKINGGFYEDIRRYGLMMRRSSHVTSWATMFAMHAMSILNNVTATNFNNEIKKLF